MTEPIDLAEDTLETLRARANALEQQLKDVKVESAARLKLAELKSAALRAGIVDVDGLRLLDPSVYADDPNSSFDAPEIVEKLRRDRPWLFGNGSSSSAAEAPSAAAGKRRLATDMSLEEWRAARAALLRRR